MIIIGNLKRNCILKYLLLCMSSNYLLKTQPWRTAAMVLFSRAHSLSIYILCMFCSSILAWLPGLAICFISSLHTPTALAIKWIIRLCLLSFAGTSSTTSACGDWKRIVVWSGQALVRIVNCVCWRENTNGIAITICEYTHDSAMVRSYSVAPIRTSQGVDTMRPPSSRQQRMQWMPAPAAV